MTDEDLSIIIVREDEAGERLDKLLFRCFEGQQSRSYFQRLIEEHLVLVNGASVKKRMKPQVGDEVEIRFAITKEIDLTPEPIPLDIIYEDDYLLAINKPAGMVVHPAPGHWSGTFVNALLHHCQLSADPSLGLRPGIVHRLDKNTSGVLLAAKQLDVQRMLIELFMHRQVHKEYLAICLGNPGKGKIEIPIGRHHKKRQMMSAHPNGGGRTACTTFSVVAAGSHLSVVKVIPITGRTHQIRVHMQVHGTPILGDPLYGNLQANRRYGAERQMLHAYRLDFHHPVTKQLLSLKATLPEDMLAFVRKIETHHSS